MNLHTELCHVDGDAGSGARHRRANLFDEFRCLAARNFHHGTYQNVDDVEAGQTDKDMVIFCFRAATALTVPEPGFIKRARMLNLKQYENSFPPTSGRCRIRDRRWLVRVRDPQRIKAKQD
jgi:hypothetical protein